MRDIWAFSQVFGFFFFFFFFYKSEYTQNVYNFFLTCGFEFQQVQSHFLELTSQDEKSGITKMHA